MRVALASFGSRGDVQPMAALAVALAARGHEVRLVTAPGYSGLVDGTGADHRVVGFDTRAIANSDEGRKVMHSGGNIAATVSAYRTIMRRAGTQLWRDLAEATEGYELLIGEVTSSLSMAAIAERRRLSFIPTAIQPRVPTRAFPHPFGPPPRRKLPGWANRLHHECADQVMWQVVRPIVNEARREVLTLPPWPFLGPAARFRGDGRLWLLAYSRHLVPRPDDWGPEIEVTGYWFLGRPGWEPPPELAAFVEAGPPPVYIGFGSMTFADATAMAALVESAIEAADCRAVVAAGWGGLAPAMRSPNIFAIDEASHEWLFPRMAAVVHHGGAGTTGAALRAGVPQVVVPFMSDQFFWAHVLHRKGIAPEPLPQHRLSAPALARAIRRALDDAAMRERAATLGALVRAEDGLGAAVERIERFAAAHPRPT